MGGKYRLLRPARASYTAVRIFGDEPGGKGVYGGSHTGKDKSGKEGRTGKREKSAQGQVI